eukprot:3211509-Pleurochrysis_carterae.AAC.2
MLYTLWLRISLLPTCFFAFCFRVFPSLSSSIVSYAWSQRWKTCPSSQRPRLLPYCFRLLERLRAALVDQQEPERPAAEAEPTARARMSGALRHAIEEASAARQAWSSRDYAVR